MSQGDLVAGKGLELDREIIRDFLHPVMIRHEHPVQPHLGQLAGNGCEMVVGEDQPSHLLIVLLSKVQCGEGDV